MRDRILSLGKDSMIYGIGSMVTRFIGLLTLPLFTAHLSPEEYGVLAMLAVLTMVAQPIFGLGLSAAMGPAYFEGNNEPKKSQVVWTAFVLSAGSSGILVLIAWCFPIALGAVVRLPAGHADLVALTLTGCALTVLATPFSQRVQFEKQARLYVAVVLATAISAIVVSIIAVVVLGWGAKGMVVGQLAGNLVTFSTFLVVAMRKTVPRASVAISRELLRLGLPLVPSFAFTFVLTHGNKYLLEWRLGLDAVGLYSIGFNLGMSVSIVTSGVATAWYPFFMTFVERQREAKEVFGRVFTYYVFGVGSLCLLYCLAAKPAVMLLTQESFHGAHIVVGLVAFGNFFQTAVNFFLPGLYFRKEVHYVSIAQGVSALISIPMNYWLIIKLGIFGGAVGFAAGNALTASLMYCWIIRRRSRYLEVAHEWSRIFSFTFLVVGVISVYLIIPGTALLGELIKSTILALLLLIALFFLLTKRERSVLHSPFAPK